MNDETLPGPTPDACAAEDLRALEATFAIENRELRLIVQTRLFNMQFLKRIEQEAKNNFNNLGNIALALRLQRQSLITLQALSRWRACPKRSNELIKP